MRQPLFHRLLLDNPFREQAGQPSLISQLPRHSVSPLHISTHFDAFASLPSSRKPSPDFLFSLSLSLSYLFLPFSPFLRQKQKSAIIRYQPKRCKENIVWNFLVYSANPAVVARRWCYPPDQDYFLHEIREIRRQNPAKKSLTRPWKPGSASRVVRHSCAPLVRKVS